MNTRQRRLSEGLCICGVKPPTGQRYCDECRRKSCEKQKRMAERRRAAGLCVCGGQLDGVRQYCEVCRGKRAARDARRKAEGVCVQCGQSAAVGRPRCSKCMAYVRRKQAKCAVDTKRAVFDHYGRRCVCCGETTPEFLSVDHVDGGGTKHRESLAGGKSGSGFYRWLRRNNFPAGFQVLCFNCNCAKGFYGECPHARAGREAQSKGA